METEETAPTILTGRNPGVTGQSVFTKTDSIKITCGLEDGF